MLGSLVRWQGFLGVIAIAAPIAAIIVWRVSRSAASMASVWRPAVMTAVATLAIAGGFHFLNDAYYARDPQWKQFLDVNELRTPFNDYRWTRDTLATRSVFDQVHWSPNDHAMIVNWFYDDPHVYSADKLRTVAAGYPWAREAAGWSHVVSWWREIVGDPALWTIWLLIPLFMLMATNRRATGAMIGISTAIVVGLLLVLMFTKLPPPRVYYSVFAFPMFLGLLLARLPAPAESSVGKFPFPARLLGWRSAIAAAAIFGFGLNEYRDFHHSRAGWRSNRDLKSALAQIQPHDDELFVNWCYPCELLPLDPPATLRGMHLLILSWLQQSPLQAAMKERFAIDEIVPALIHNPKVFLVSIPRFNALCTVYTQRTLSADLDWDHRYDFEQFPVWKPRLVPQRGTH